MTTRVVRCPSCSTAFRVADDQLRVHDGFVRCGVCETVFNGWEAVQDQPASTRADPNISPVTNTTSDDRTAPHREGGKRTSSTEPAGWQRPGNPTMHREPQSTGFSALGEGAGPARADPTAGGPEAQGVTSSTRGQPPTTQRERHSSSPATSVRPAPQVKRPTARTRYQHEPYTEARYADPRYRDPRYASTEPESEGFSAVSRHRSSPTPVTERKRRSGLMATVWQAGVLLGLLVLLLQLVVWWRTPIATHVPVVRPLLVNVCEALGCVVGYVRAPQYLTIESSSLRPAALDDGRGRGERFVLEAVLRNRAPHPQPWPTLEVDLTDHSDTVVIRKGLSPHEYLDSQAMDGPFPANSERRIAVELEKLTNIPVSGYRLDLYFP